MNKSKELKVAIKAAKAAGKTRRTVSNSIIFFIGKN